MGTERYDGNSGYMPSYDSRYYDPWERWKYDREMSMVGMARAQYIRDSVGLPQDYTKVPNKKLLLL